MMHTLHLPRGVFKDFHINKDRFFEFKFILSICSTWATIIFTLIFVHWVEKNSGWVNLAIISLPTIITIGTLQYILIHAAHECVHQEFQTNNLRSWLFAAITAYPIGLTRNLREEHLRHHRYLGVPEIDPDYPVYRVFPKSKLSFLYFIFINASGISAFLQFFNRIKTQEKSGDSLNGITTKSHLSEKQSKFEFFYTISFQLTILYMFFCFFNPFYYFVFYLFPLLSVAKTLAQLRGLAEHGDPTGKIVLRSFLGKDLFTKIMGVYGFSFHAEHHLSMSVSYLGLRDVNEHLMRAPEGLGREIQIYARGHLQLLYEWFVASPWREKKND